MVATSGTQATLKHMQGLRKDDDAAFKSDIVAEIKHDVSVLLSNAVNQLSRNFVSLIGDAGGKLGGGGKDDDLKSLKNGFFVTPGGLGSQDGIVSLNNKVQVVEKASEKDNSDSGGEEDEYQSHRSSSTIVSAALKDREVVGGGKKTKGVKGKDKDNTDKDKKGEKEGKADKDKNNKEAVPIGILIFHRMPN